MLSDREQKSLGQGIDKVSSKVDDLDKKFSKIETVLEGIEKILEEQSKRMTAIETWFLSIQTLSAGAIITVLIKISF